MLKNFPVFLIVFSGLLSVKRAVAHNEIETAWEVLCSSKLNFQFLEMNFQNERTVSQMLNHAYELLPSVQKLERLLGHNLNITAEILRQRVQDTIDRQVEELGIKIIRAQLQVRGLVQAEQSIKA